jgi:nickel/cobalt exporter
VGFVHTLLGPDHYLPFVAMARLGNWSLRRTLAITVGCGLLHVGSSVVLGLVGLALGATVLHLESIESWRGELAAWLLIGFGLLFMARGLRSALRNRPHTHLHAHANGTIHSHDHVHEGEHLHAHAPPGEATKAMRAWVLFTVFLFGPCEPLIPLIIAPAIQGRPWSHVAWVGAVFGLVTVGVMVVVVSTLFLTTQRVDVGGRLGRFSDAMAGGVLLACGAAVKLGL